MSPRRTLATSKRVLTELSHDKRSLLLIFLVPIVLETLLRLIYYDNRPLFNRVGGPMLGIFPLVMMFVIASVATLRERTRGTLERLLVMPLNKVEFVLGYALAFSIVAIVQASLVALITLGPLGLNIAGPDWLVLLVAAIDGLLGMALGLFASAFASSEFHVVQFMPAIILPQFLLCGFLVPREHMQAVLHYLSDILPLSYSVDAMHILSAQKSVVGTTFWSSVFIVAGFSIVSLFLGATSIRRQTA